VQTVLVALGTVIVTVAEEAPGAAVEFTTLQPVLLPLVTVVPMGLSNVTPAGSVSVKVTVCAAVLVFVNAYPTASEVLRLIGLFSKAVLIVTGLVTAMAAGASAAAVAIVASALSATHAIRCREANLRAMSLKTDSPCSRAVPALEIPVVQ
jgi:hypothetical protein